MTPSEEYIADLCTRSFLPFWSHASPRNAKGKEVCDAIVVFESNVVLISVKEIAVSRTAVPEVALERWRRKAIDESIKQLYGAQRALDLPNQKLFHPNGHPIPLPETGVRQMFRVAIAFGAKKRSPIAAKDYGKGFVHVMDEQSVETIFKELDTVSDFLQYFAAKERLLSNKRLICSSEADLLAYYFTDGFEGPIAAADFVYIDDGLWDRYSTSSDYEHFRLDIEASYFWDAMIASFHGSIENRTIDTYRRDELERALRRLNGETRLGRKDLAHMFEDIGKVKSRARIVIQTQESGYLYVLMRVHESNREAKDKELALRCLVAKVLYPQVPEVIGICAVSNEKNLWWDFVHLNTPDVTEEMRTTALAIQNELGYFANMQRTLFNANEHAEGR